MKLRSQYVRMVVSCCLGSAAVLACSCASREPDQAAAPRSPTSVSQPNAAPASPEAVAAPPPMEQQSAANGPSGNAPSETGQRLASEATPSVAQPQAALKQRARGAAEPAPSPPRASRKESAVHSSETADVSPAEPTLGYSESKALLAAVVEFDTEWDRLTTSRGCDDACRAFESMRRSAKKICELVVPQDPRQRCRTAQARLDQASRDLAARCTECH